MRTTRLTGDQYAAEILRTIKKVREENKACTAREVSRLMRETHNLVVRQLEVLRAAGYVNWTLMQGSLVVTPAGGKYIVAVQKGETPLADAKRRAKLDNEQSPPAFGSEGPDIDDGRPAKPGLSTTEDHHSQSPSLPDGTADGQSPGSVPSSGND